MTINGADYEDTRNFQKPSILYIMEDYHSLIEALAEWRRENGYIVTVVERDETGSSTTNIKNFIEDAYYNWENPPEYVCLVGDTSGSLDVNTFTVGQTGGWSSAQAESDFPYALQEGDDFLPDLFIGRISVRSNTELGVVTVSYTHLTLPTNREV